MKMTIANTPDIAELPEGIVVAEDGERHLYVSDQIAFAQRSGLDFC
jgi:hypothetical protein